MRAVSPSVAAQGEIMSDAEQIPYDDVVFGRRSTRGFKPDRVPRRVIEEVLALAMRAPSSLNTQPWNFYVISGEALDRIRHGNVERNLAGIPESREFRKKEDYAGAHRERQIEIAKQLFTAMDIQRDDKRKRKEWVLRGFRQFDAPVSVVITYDRSLFGSDIAPFDCGAVTNALVNAAWSRGLGCCINSQGIMQSPVVREHAGIADDQVIMICVAMGYPDESFPANAVVSNRKTVDEAATFIGFDQE
jgi:nitroreductase